MMKLAVMIREKSSTNTVILLFCTSLSRQIMQATSGIKFENVGRRFMMYDWRVNAPTSVSSRLQNWVDYDGSVTGFGEYSLIGSGEADTGLWWVVDDNVVHDEQGPLNFIRTSDGPERGLASFAMVWDADLAGQTGKSVCGNGEQKLPCPKIGSLRHRGPRFAQDGGLPMTAVGDVTGLAGGYGWLLELDAGPPKEMKFSLVEVDPDTPLLLSIAYPVGTTFEFEATTEYCWEEAGYSCSLGFESVASIDDVRNSNGNAYHVASDGVLTFRLIMSPAMFVGNPDFVLPTWEDPNRSGTWFALDRFEREGILLPRGSYGISTTMKASNCGGSGNYCAAASADATSADNVCPPGYDQVAYDKCCSGTTCVYANSAAATSSVAPTLVKNASMVPKSNVTVTAAPTQTLSSQAPKVSISLDPTSVTSPTSKTTGVSSTPLTGMSTPLMTKPSSSFSFGTFASPSGSAPALSPVSAPSINNVISGSGVSGGASEVAASIMAKLPAMSPSSMFTTSGNSQSIQNAPIFPMSGFQGNPSSPATSILSGFNGSSPRLRGSQGVPVVQVNFQRPPRE
jgi:hypothetical protein